MESTRGTTVVRPLRRLRRSAHESGDSPTTVWHRISSGMLKLPPAARTDACGVSDIPVNASEGSPPAAARQIDQVGSRAESFVSGVVW